MCSTTRGEPKQRVAWLVVDFGGEAWGVYVLRRKAVEAVKGGWVPSSLGPYSFRRVTYPWPQKEAKRGRV